MKINRETVYSKCNGKCGYCGESITIKEMQVDHIISQRNFWGDVMNKIRVPTFLKHLTIDDVNHIDNLMPACRYCNKWKDTFTVEDFRNEIMAQVERANKYSSNYRMAKRYGLVTESVYEKPLNFYFETL